MMIGARLVFHGLEVPDPVVYVLSRNLHRRDLTPSQRAMIGSKARDWYDAEAKKRQAEQARRNQPQSQKVETLPPLEKAKSRDQAGAAVGVSGKTMDKAKKVREQGHKKLVEAVESGKIDGAQNAHQQKEKTAEQPPGATIRQIRPEGTDRTEIMPSGQRAAYCPTR